MNQAMTSASAILSPLIGGIIAGINNHALYFFAGLSALFAFSILICSKVYLPQQYD